MTEPTWLKGLIVTLILFSAWYCYAAHLFDSPGIKGARAYIPGCATLYLGEGKPGETLEGSFEIGNIGTEPLRFRVRASCNCSSLHPESGEVGPNSKQSILIKVRLRQEGKGEDVIVWVDSNDETTPAIRYNVAASCPKPVSIVPSTVDFGSLLEGTAASREITVAARSKASVVRCFATKYLTVREQPARALAEQGQATFELSLHPATPKGELLGEVTFAFADGEQESATVSARICPSVMTSPEYLVSASQSASTLKVVAWRYDGRSLGKLRAVEADKWISVCDDDKEPTVRRCLKLSLATPRPKAGAFPVRIWFENAQDPALVTILSGK